VNKVFLAIAVSALLLTGCEDAQQAGGGIETSDFQARVLAPSGCPVAGARVWLVRSGGDTAPATAIDSAVTGPDGIAKLKGPTSGGALLGLDASAAVWLGMTPREALMTSTVTSAELMGWQNEIGTLEKGKFADHETRLAARNADDRDERQDTDQPPAKAHEHTTQYEPQDIADYAHIARSKDKNNPAAVSPAQEPMR